MSKSKKTRCISLKEELNKTSQAAAIKVLRKVFYIPEALLKKETATICLERFYQPGKGRSALFLTEESNGNIMEVLEFAEPHRSWLINSEICSNGKIYLITPIDSTFLALHHIRKHCTDKALSLDSIHDEQDSSVNRLLTKFLLQDQLRSIADIKCSGDMVFYKYNSARTMAWLVLKTQQVVKALKQAQIHCGHNALSQNYARSDKLDDESAVNEIDYLRMACDIIGNYLDLDLYENLKNYLKIPSEIQALVKEKETAQKRKSLKNLNSNDGKKIKLDATGNDGVSEAALKLKNNSLLDTSMDEPIADVTPVKARSLTAKEKSLAKGAKGTKSITSFFKKA